MKAEINRLTNHGSVRLLERTKLTELEIEQDINQGFAVKVFTEPHRSHVAHWMVWDRDHDEGIIIVRDETEKEIITILQERNLRNRIRWVGVINFTRRLSTFKDKPKITPEILDNLIDHAVPEKLFARFVLSFDKGRCIVCGFFVNVLHLENTRDLLANNLIAGDIIGNCCMFEADPTIETVLCYLGTGQEYAIFRPQIKASEFAKI